MSAQVLKLEAELELLKEHIFIASALGRYHEAPSASEPLPSVSANAILGKTSGKTVGKNSKLNRSVGHDPTLCVHAPHFSQSDMQSQIYIEYHGVRRTRLDQAPTHQHIWAC